MEGGILLELILGLALIGVVIGVLFLLVGGLLAAEGRESRVLRSRLEDAVEELIGDLRRDTRPPLDPRIVSTPDGLRVGPLLSAAGGTVVHRWSGRLGGHGGVSWDRTWEEERRRGREVLAEGLRLSLSEEVPGGDWALFHVPPEECGLWQPPSGVQEVSLSSVGSSPDDLWAAVWWVGVSGAVRREVLPSLPGSLRVEGPPPELRAGAPFLERHGIELGLEIGVPGGGSVRVPLALGVPR